MESAKSKHFEIEHDRFFLYPTFEHQRNDVVRDSHQPELGARSRRACGPRPSRPPSALTRDGGIPQPERVRIRAWAEVAAHYGHGSALRGRAVAVLRLDARLRREAPAWKRRHPLHVILLRTYRIPRPVTVKVRDEFRGCRSWLEIQRDLPFEGTPGALRRGVRRASEEIEAIATAACVERVPALA